MASHFQREREREKEKRSSFQCFALKCAHCEFRATSGLETPTAAVQRRISVKLLPTLIPVLPASVGKVDGSVAHSVVS